jgi:hypothetical protein
MPVDILDQKVAERRELLRVIEEAITGVEQQRHAPLTEDRIAAVRAFAEELQRGITRAEEDFTTRRELIELMNVRVQLYWEGQELWLNLTSDRGEGVKRFALKASNKHQHKTQLPNIRITGYRRFRKRW